MNMKKGRFSWIALFLAFLMVSPLATAAEVYLNGVNIKSVTNQTFKNATVRIDAKGDVHIDAPGYEVKVVDDGKPSYAPAVSGPAAIPPGPNPNLANKYFLVTKPSYNGNAQYDITLSINGIERKVIRAGSKPIILEISSWLQKGDNKIEIVARKNLYDGRKSTSSSDLLHVVLGQGHESGRRVVIDKANVSFKCTAAQTKNMARKYNINAI